MRSVFLGVHEKAFAPHGATQASERVRKGRHGFLRIPGLKTELVEDAFRQAVLRERPGPGLIVHSDRGCRYAGHQFRQVLTQHQALSSMSGKGNRHDNAAMESFWATLKTDLNIRQAFKTKEEARQAIFDYIEVFYNRFRLHSALDDLTPLDCETNCVKLCVCV